MSKRRPGKPLRDETERAPLVEWSLAWLMLLAAGVMLVGALARLTAG